MPAHIGGNFVKFVNIGKATRLKLFALDRKNTYTALQYIYYPRYLYLPSEAKI